MASSSNRELTPGSGDEMASSPDPPEVAEAPPGAEPGDDETAPAVPLVPAAVASRPYYECVFCKRGFTTAQALGGHMNIHRRDRAKPSLRAPGGTTASVSRYFGCFANQSHYNLPAYPPPTVPPVTSMTISMSGSFSMNYQGTGAVTGVVDADASANPSSDNTRELSLFGAAARDYGGSGEAPEGSERHEGEPERELDLELRLGRRPRH